MRYCIPLVLALGAAALPARLSGQQSACRLADSVSARMVTSLTRVSTGTDPLNTQIRGLMQLPQVAPGQIVNVTDRNVCNKILPVYNTTTARSDSLAPSGKLYVVAVGSVYVAWDPVKTVGEKADFVVLTNKFKVLTDNAY